MVRDNLIEHVGYDRLSKVNPSVQSVSKEFSVISFDVWHDYSDP